MGSPGSSKGERAQLAEAPAAESQDAGYGGNVLTQKVTASVTPEMPGTNTFLDLLPALLTLNGQGSGSGVRIPNKSPDVQNVQMAETAATETGCLQGTR